MHTEREATQDEALSRLLGVSFVDQLRGPEEMLDPRYEGRHGRIDAELARRHLYADCDNREAAGARTGSSRHDGPGPWPASG